MKPIYIIILIALFSCNAFSQSWQWANSGGGANFDIVGGGCITVDQTGNTYVIGSFYGTMLLDTIQLTGNGWNKDVFWAKFDKNGRVVWAISTGGKGEDHEGGIVVDSIGNVYVFLSFSDTIINTDFQLYNSGFRNDLLLIKCDNAGNYLTHKTWGTLHDEIANNIKIDNYQNIYLLGTYSGFAGTPQPTDSIDFDGHILRSRRGSDIFTVKIDKNLFVIWAKTAGGTSGEFANNLSVDKYANVIISGSTAYKIQFDTVQLADPDLNLFIAKYDSSGNALWARMGKTFDLGTYWISCATGSDGSVYCTGTYDASSVGAASVIDFGGPAYYLNEDNAFLVKYDPDGIIQWAKPIGITARDAAYDIALDTGDNIYITGTYDWWGKFGNDTFYSAGGDDIYVNKYDKDGNYMWTATAGGATNDGGYAITLDKEQNIYIGGYISSSPASFGSHQVSSHGAWDMCVAKLSPLSSAVHEIRTGSKDIAIIPNPNNGSFSIEVIKPGNWQQLQITDVTGKVVYSQQLTAGNRQQMTVAAKLTSGMYFLKLINKSSTATEKFMVHD